MKWDIKAIQGEIDSIYEDVRGIRREIHQHPELSEQESRTSRLVSERLSDLGIEYTSGIAGHGVVGVIRGRNPMHAVGIRADMDALPIAELTDLPFRSVNEGVMHACGHDLHTAILIGSAMILSRMKEMLPGSVKLFFQPAEETIGGARQMIEAGCLAKPAVSSVIGLHVDPTLSVGAVELIPGPVNAASCEFTAKVTGIASHGAHPDQGIDALLPACAMVTSLQSIITRQMDPAEPALITVGKFSGGTKANTLADVVTFTGIIRTLSLSKREFVKQSLQRVCERTAEAFGASCELIFNDSYPPLINDGRLYDIMKRVAEKTLGAEHVRIGRRPSLGSDDFAYFCHQARGLYFNIGTGTAGRGRSVQDRADLDFSAEKISVRAGLTCNKAFAKELGSGSESAADCTAPLHNGAFCPDEECIKTGILLEVLGVLEILADELDGNG